MGFANAITEAEKAKICRLLREGHGTNEVCRLTGWSTVTGDKSKGVSDGN